MAACSSLLADPQGLCPRSVDLEFTPAQRAELSQNLARRGCWKLSTWQPPAQGFSLLAVAAGGCPGERLGREQLQMRLSAPLSQESQPAPAEAPASPCRAVPAAVGARCWAGARLLAALPWVPARLCTAACDGFGLLVGRVCSQQQRVASVGPALQEPNSEGRLQASIRTSAFLLLP